MLRPVGDDGRVAGRPRGFETVGDMLRSLAVVGGFVAVLMLITLRQTPDQDRSVDPDPVVAAAVEVAPFPASVPPATPDGWRPTSARVTPPESDPFSWYVGYITPEDRFVAVTESDGSRESFLGEIGVEGEAEGASLVAGTPWQRLDDPDGLHRALVREQNDVITVVTGTASYEVLEDVAASLRTS
jgi:hypothetical protein